MAETTEVAGRRSGRASLPRLVALLLLRVAVGWHLLHEGLARLSDGGWTAASHLELEGWVLAPALRSIAASPGALWLVGFLETWGLVLAGLALVLGCVTRAAAGLGIALVLVYYAAHPPFAGLALVIVLIFPTGTFFGLDILIERVRERRRRAATTADGPAGPAAVQLEVAARRDVLGKLAAVPLLGTFAVAALGGFRGARAAEAPPSGEKPPAPPKPPGRDGGGAAPDAVTSATIKSFEYPTLKDLKGRIPQAAIGKMKLGRLILGGNLIGGWAHARDLIYVSDLVKAYHHKWKVFETFLLAEKCGVNAILTNPVLCGVINEYWQRKIGKIQFISDCGGSNLLDMVKKSIDSGAAACYVQGGTADQLVREGRIIEMWHALDLIRQNGLPAGIGAHAIETVKACVEDGLEPDFWMKTLHHHNYWSAKPRERHDSVWCEKPEETVAFMKGLPQPWIAFKILAAGAIHPNQGFRYAFQNGADFICVGMYDFQLVQDVNIALDVLKGDLKRDRPWRA